MRSANSPAARAPATNMLPVRPGGSFTHDLLRRTATANTDAAVHARDACRRSAKHVVCTVARQLRAILIVFKPLTEPPSALPNGDGLYGPRASAVVSQVIVNVINASLRLARASEREAFDATRFARRTAFAADTQYTVATESTDDATSSHSRQDTQSLLDAISMARAMVGVHDQKHEPLHEAMHVDAETTVATWANALAAAQERLRAATQRNDDAAEVLRALHEKTIDTTQRAADAKEKAVCATDNLQRHIDALATRCTEATHTHEIASVAASSVHSDDCEHDTELTACIANAFRSIYHAQQLASFHALVVAANTLCALGIDDITVPMSNEPDIE